MSLFAELRRRNVLRLAALYLVGSWLIVQVAETLLPIFHTPDWVLQTLVVLLALGFMPALVFSWVFELTPQGLKRDAEVTPEHSIATQTGRRMDRLLAVGLLTVVALVAADRYWPREMGSERGSESLSGPADRVSAKAPGPESDSDPLSGAPEKGSDALLSPPQKSIAVLPFVNMSADRENEYFSDGISEEILNALAKVGDLKVAGRTSSFHFKDKDESLATIGTALGVAHVLEGSVRKQGEKVRITAQLIQVKDGFHLWSETYEGNLQDLFALQERIARSITDELKVVLQGAQARRLVNAGTANVEAYALYLQATDIFNRRDGERFAQALAQLQEAIALDPEFARAYSRLATLNVVLTNTRSADFAASMAAVEKYAQRASEIDPALAEPHAALGMALSNQRRFREARAAMSRAVELDPDDVTVNFWHGIALMNTGYFRRGKEAMDKALRVDPLLPNALFWRGRAYIADGDLVSAERMLRRAADGGHGFVGHGLAWLEHARGNRAAAIAQFTLGLKYFASDFPPEAPDLFARACYGDAEAKSQALALIDSYLASRPATIAGVVPYVLIRSGEVARGFALMQDKATNNDSLNSGELLSPLLTEARRAPEFAELARRMGWAAYWDEHGPPDLCAKTANGDYVCK